MPYTVDVYDFKHNRKAVHIRSTVMMLALHVIT